MMKLHTVETTERDERPRRGAHLANWTLRSAIEATSPTGRTVAAITAISALATTLHSDVPLAAGVAVAAMLPAAMVDVVDRRLPNRMVAAAAALGLAVGMATVLLGSQLDAFDAALGAAACAGPLLAMHLFSPASMGFGDVKAAAVIGAAVGLIHPLYGLVALTLASLAAAGAGLARRQRTIPFGPALVGGAVVTLILVASSAGVLSAGQNGAAPPPLLSNEGHRP